jgi:hypothetical protein
VEDIIAWVNDGQRSFLIRKKAKEQSKYMVSFGYVLGAYNTKVFVIVSILKDAYAPISLLSWITPEPIHPLFISVPDAGYIEKVLAFE